MDMVSQHDADRGMDERRREGWEEGARVGLGRKRPGGASRAWF